MQQGSWPHHSAVRADPTSPPSDDGSAGDSFSGSDGRDVDMNSAGRSDDKPSPQSEASGGAGDLAFYVKLQSGARSWPPRMVHMPSSPFPTVPQVLFQAARVEAFAAVKLNDRVLSPDANLSDAVTQAGLSGPIPLEYTFNETVKECTCIGCDNFLVKRSSRRACDICQARGHSLSNRRVLRLVIPNGVPIRDSPSGIVKYPKTPVNIDPADPSVVLTWLNTFSHWKFEGTPQDFAALDLASHPSVAAASAAGPNRVKPERPTFASTHAQIFVVFKEESMVDEVIAEAQRIGLPSLDDLVAPHAIAMSRLPEDSNLRCRLRMISHYWKLEVRALLPNRRFKDFVFSKLGKQNGRATKPATPAPAAPTKRVAPRDPPPSSPRTTAGTSSMPINLNVGGYSLSYRLPVSLPLPMSVSAPVAPAVHAPLPEAQPAASVMPVSMAVQLAPVPGVPNQFTLVPAVQQNPQLQFAAPQSMSAQADAPMSSFSVSVPAPPPATSSELLTYLSQSQPQTSLSFDHFASMTGSAAPPQTAPAGSTSMSADGHAHQLQFPESQFHAPQLSLEQHMHQMQQQQQQMQPQIQQLQQQQQQMQQLQQHQFQMQQQQQQQQVQQVPQQLQLQLPPQATQQPPPQPLSLSQPFSSGSFCDSALLSPQRPLAHSLAALADHDKLAFAAPACEPDRVSDLSPATYSSSQLHTPAPSASVVVAHSTPSHTAAYGPATSSESAHPAGTLREEQIRVSNPLFSSLSRCSDLVVKGILTPEQASDLATAEQRVLMRPEAASMPVLFVFRDLRSAAREAQAAHAADHVHSAPRRRRQRSHSPHAHPHAGHGQFHLEGDDHAQSAQKRGRTVGDGWPVSMAVGDVLSDESHSVLSSEASDPSDGHPAHGTLFNEMLGDLRHGLQGKDGARPDGPPPPPPYAPGPTKRHSSRRPRVVVNQVTQQLSAIELEVKRGKIKRPEGVSSEAVESAMKQQRWYRLNKFSWNPWLLAIEGLLAVAAITLLFNAVLLNQSHNELDQPSVATDTPAPLERDETWNIMAPFNNPVRLHTQLTSVEADSRDILKAMSGVSWLFSNFLTVFNVSIDTIPFRYVTSRVNLLQRAVDAISVANAMANVVEDFSDNYQLLNSSTAFQAWSNSKCIILQNTLSQAVLYNLCGRTVLQLRPYPYPFDSMDNFTADSTTCRAFRMNLASFYESVHDQLQDSTPTHSEQLHSLGPDLDPAVDELNDMDPVTAGDQSFAGLPTMPNAFAPEQRHPSARFRVSRYSTLRAESEADVESSDSFEWDAPPAAPAAGNRFRSLRDLTPASQNSPNSNNYILPVDSTGIFNDTQSCANGMAYLLKFFMYQKWDDQNFKADPSLWQFRMRSSADQLRTQAAVLHVPVSMLGNLNRNAPTSIYVQSRDWQLRGYALFILSFGAQGLHILLLFLLYGIYFAYKWCSTSKIVMLPLAQRPEPAPHSGGSTQPFVGSSVHLKSTGPLPTIAEKTPPTGLENVTVVGEPDVGSSSATLQETEMSEL